jgi:Ca2+-dependent lipid-binding protein
MPFGELEVYVEGALGIKNTSVFGNSSPYCVLTCGTQQSKTPIAQDGGSNPYWNTTVKFKIDRSCQELGVKIFSHNILTADDEIAYTRYHHVSL